MNPQYLILLAVLATGMGQTIVFAVLAPLGREVGLVEFEVGVIIAASSVVFSFASPRWGRWSEHAGRRRTLLVGLLGYTGGTLLFATGFLAGLEGWLTGATLLLALCVARMLQSTVMAAASPAAVAYMADITTPEQRTRGIGKLNAAHNIGTVIGPAVGGGLAVFSLLAPLYAAATVTLLTALLVWRFLPESPRARMAQHAVPPPLRYTDRRVLPFLVVGVMLYMGFSVVQQTLGFYIQDSLQVDSRETAKLVGMALMVCALSSLAAQFLAVRRGWPAFRLMATGLPLVLLACVVLVFAGTAWQVAVAMALLGAGTGFAGPGYGAAASTAVGASEQGGVAGLVSAAPALGYIVGPLAGTGLYHADPHLPYLFVAVSFLPLLYFLHRYGRSAR